MKNLWQTLAMVRRCDNPLFWRRVFYVALQSLLPVAGLYILKLLVDEVTNNVSSGVFSGMLPVLAGLFAVIYLLQRLTGTLLGINSDVMSQKIIDYVSELVQRQASTLDMSFYDSPSYHDTLHRAQQEISSRPIQVVGNFMSLAGSLISLTGAAVLIAGSSWLLIFVMLAAALPTAFVRFAKARNIYSFRRESTPTVRLTNYYSALLTQKTPAAELRALGLAPFFRHRFVESRHKIVVKLIKISRKLGRYDALCSIVETLALLVALVMMLNSTYNGAMTIGSFVMVFEAFRRGMGYLQTAVGAVSGLYDNRLFLGNLFEFLSLQSAITDDGDGEPFPECAETIEFHDITFRYPDMNRDVLSHFNLTARRGEITRIEGENGFGKTTLLKLLLRLYEPENGYITVNGTDLRRINIGKVRSNLGVMFQETIRYNCTVAENIAFGRVNSPIDRQLMIRAARMAGVDKIIEKLPNGYDTLLGRMFDDGAELSMGQWQRIALARLIYKDPQVMLFDEPTAWLDAKARENFYEMLETLKENKIIILISHSQ